MNKQEIRKTTILEIEALEILEPNEEGVELNEGYGYHMKGSIPQIADSIAKMAIEMDKHEEMGENGGEMFLQLIISYYEQEKGGN